MPSTLLSPQDVLGMLCASCPPPLSSDDKRTAAVPSHAWATHTAANLYAITGILCSPAAIQDQFVDIFHRQCGGDFSKLRERYGDTQLGSSGQPQRGAAQTGSAKRGGTLPSATASISTSQQEAMEDPTSPRHASPPRGGASTASHFGAPSTSNNNNASSLPTSSAPLAGNESSVSRMSAAAAGSSCDVDEPQDAIDALWSFAKTAAQQSQLNRLRFETPLSPETLSNIIQQFSLVEGADVFFAPVPAATIMEYNEVRSGPYNSVIYGPLSLMQMKGQVSDSRRHYHMFSHTREPNTANRRDHNRAAHSDTDIITDTLNATECDALLSTHSRPEQLLTIGEMERAVWQITANCTMFNAPESFYPNTARRFALACTAILSNYCQSQLISA